MASRALLMVAFMAVAMAVAPHPQCKALVDTPASSFLETEQASFTHVFCDDCNEGVAVMVDWCTAPENHDDFSGFCDSNMQSKNEECKFMVQQIPKIFCPQSPCQKLRSSHSHQPGAVCDHGLINCSPRVPLQPTTLPPITGVDCGTCGSMLSAFLKWCENSETLDEPEPGLCKTDFPDKYRECEFLADVVRPMFAPQSLCDGLKCLGGNLDKVCNGPPINCGGDSDVEALNGPKAKMFPDYVLYFNNSNIFEPPAHKGSFQGVIAEVAEAK